MNLYVYVQRWKQQFWLLSKAACFDIQIPKTIDICITINKTHCFRRDHLEKPQSRGREKTRRKEKQILRNYSDRRKPDTNKRRGREKGRGRKRRRDASKIGIQRLTSNWIAQHSSCLMRIYYSNQMFWERFLFVGVRLILRRLPILSFETPPFRLASSASGFNERWTGTFTKME